MSLRKIGSNLQTSSAFTPATTKQPSLRGRKVEQWSANATPETAKASAISQELLQRIFAQLPSGQLEKGKPYTVTVDGKTYTVIPLQDGLTREGLLQALKEKRVKVIQNNDLNDKAAELRSQTTWERFRGDLQHYSPNGFIAQT